MIRWTGLAPWEFELPFLGSLTSTFLTPQPTPRTLDSKPETTNSRTSAGGRAIA